MAITSLVNWIGHRRIALAGALAVAAFALLAGRFWHPYFGFTKFIQIDQADAAIAIREVRERPVFFYPGENGYDATAYAQIAFYPLLDSPELQPAIRNVPYRARRILGSALAWLLAGGNPDYIANTYAALNLAVWLVLAGVSWRLLKVTDARKWVAWAGLMFSAGALHAVRLALTDLLAVTLLAVAMLVAEKSRSRFALVLLAAAGLARETVLAAVVALWRGPWFGARPGLANVARTVVVAAPLAAWMVYVRWKAGPADQGFGNFEWPLVAFVVKWGATFAGFERDPNFRGLTLATLLATLALAAQAAFVLRRLQFDSPWWRIGAANVALMALLGTSVWEGHPGASTRVLLPLSLAFAVLAVRTGASWRWLLAGGLSVFSGVLALWHVPQDAGELAAGRFSRGAFVARPTEGWFAAERNARDVWAWSAGDATLAIDVWPRTDATVRVQLDVRAVSSRPLEIAQGGRIVWRGEVGARKQRIDLTDARVEQGRVVLTLKSGEPASADGAAADPRALAFAVYGVRLE